MNSFLWCWQNQQEAFRREKVTDVLAPEREALDAILTHPNLTTVKDYLCKGAATQTIPRQYSLSRNLFHMLSLLYREVATSCGLLIVVTNNTGVKYIEHLQQLFMVNASR